jgi:hypothetical protein
MFVCEATNEFPAGERELEPVWAREVLLRRLAQERLRLENREDFGLSSKEAIVREKVSREFVDREVRARSLGCQDRGATWFGWKKGVCKIRHDE